MISTEAYKTVNEEAVTTWFKAAPVNAFPSNGGTCVQYKGKQIAVFNFSRRNEWYACQNLCPHKMQMILSRGLIGTHQEEPKVACPFHKKSFSLKTGECINGDECSLATYPVKIKDEHVYIGFKE
ncbi:nitrite reductase (NADH) small subunit [Catalinimonas alkaloidigena]|uniref:nitrite reductase small subunit NirD n=1 Tax=Catalinimonas alkaloidigena TaxID=1075417 RepID=UPI002406D30D|nr:nitrite reductase small subunit NirD [Catalinimonas alkaloidigena]MDF9799042.1 nitrite reductase (NADH) small subunit [Catalinimonas alkaloidigena]